MFSPFPPPPQTGATQADHGRIEPRVVAAGAGATWWAEGWRTFTAQIGTWIGIVIVYVVISLLLSKVPYIGGVAQWLLTPVFVGGIMLGCNALDRSQPLRVSHLFDGFKGAHFTSLLMVGVFNILLTAVAVVLAVAIIAAGVGAAGVGAAGVMNFDQLAADPWKMLGEFGLVALLLLLLALVVVAVIAMANWFAPALIVLREARPLEAMLLSFRASLRNWAPFLLYGVIGVGLVVAVACVFGVLAGLVGFGALMAVFSESVNWGSMIFGIVALVLLYVACAVVVTPVVFGSAYAGYRDTLAVQDSPPANPA
jgi:hypothetical protein